MCIFLHSWSQWEYKKEVCAKVRVCSDCNKKDYDVGWHSYSTWSEPYFVVMALFNSRGKVGEGGHDEQKRVCSNCKLVETRKLK